MNKLKLSGVLLFLAGSFALTGIITAEVFYLSGYTTFNSDYLIRNSERSLQQRLLVGLAILTVLSLLPFFGELVVFLVNLFGLGVILLWRFGREIQVATK